MSTIDKKLNAREALMKVALELFTEKGYEAVSTRELAEKAGVNLGAIQYHFGSKAKLFVETVRTMMHGNNCHRGREILSLPVSSRKDAAVRLSSYIAAFLDSLLRPEGPQPCKIMLREIFTPTSNDAEMFEALTSAVVNDFIKPNDELLLAVIKVVAPEISEAKAHHTIASIVGQCFFYLTHAPFLLRLRDIDCSRSPHFEETVRHVAEFSMRGLGCEEILISAALEEMQIPGKN